MVRNWIDLKPLIKREIRFDLTVCQRWGRIAFAKLSHRALCFRSETDEAAARESDGFGSWKRMKVWPG